MSVLRVILFAALASTRIGFGLPVKSSPETYPQYPNGSGFHAWGSEGLYTALPALALVLTAVGLLFGCTWCYRHKDCKTNGGAENQLFVANASHIQDVRRSNPPDSGFSEPVNNNLNEDNNNGPISLREMQNIANNNATAYIVSENEERNRVSRESVVEFEPLPSGLRVIDPLEPHADWFDGNDLPRNRLQYVREIGRGWFGRVVQSELEDNTTPVVARILNQDASLEDKARFLNEARLYRGARHDHVLPLVAKCLQEEPWILMLEFCPVDLNQYLVVNRPKMAILNESGVPLRLMSDVTSALAYLHARGLLYSELWSGNVLTRGEDNNVRAVLGQHLPRRATHDYHAPEYRDNAPYTSPSEVWSLGSLLWEVCAWGAPPPPAPPPPALPCPYRSHLYQVMQLCWNVNPEGRPSAAQVHALISHLYTSLTTDSSHDDGYSSSDFEERWQRLKPNTIPIIDEHVAIVHAPSTSTKSHFTGSDLDPPTIQDTLSIDMDTAVSRSSSIMSDKEPLSMQIKSESLTNLHGSLEDVRNIYLTHNETAALECHQGNMSFEERDNDRSDSSMDPWVKEIIAGSQDDVSYFKDVSDVIKNLDNILNSEKTSSSESSHQASPSRDNLSLDCKKDYPVQTSMVKSPCIRNFQNILEMGFDAEGVEPADDDHDTVGSLSHSFERHSDTLSQQTLENLTPITPGIDFEVACAMEFQKEAVPEVSNVIVKNETKTVSTLDPESDVGVYVTEIDKDNVLERDVSVVDKEELCKNVEAIVVNYETEINSSKIDIESPKQSILSVSGKEIPKLMELCIASVPSLSVMNKEHLNVREDCESSCDNNLKEIVRTEMNAIESKSIDNTLTSKKPEYPSNIKENGPVELSEIEKDILVHTILPKVEETGMKEPDNECILLAEAVVKEVIETAELKADSNNHCEIVKVSSIIKSESQIITEGNRHHSEVNETPKLCDYFQESSEPVILNENVTPLNDDTLPETNFENTEINYNDFLPTNAPDTVQTAVHSLISETIDSKTEHNVKSPNSHLNSIPASPEIVQNDNSDAFTTPTKVIHENVDNIAIRSDEDETIVQAAAVEDVNNSTAYIDLINGTSREVLENNVIDDNIKNVIQSCLSTSSNDSNCSLVKNESTVYLDLPSVINNTDNFLQSERILSSKNFEPNVICASTPKGSDVSADQTLENSVKEENDMLSETKVPEHGPGIIMTKLEQRSVPENFSPFDSPTKSHPTDTYDENSSVVLGPFENCTLDLFKGVKSNIEPVDVGREELLAFSSNFSEIDLETPSPLRDVNFLNEVPDIIPDDDIQFDNIADLELGKSEPASENNDDTDGHSTTEKHISPSTPPNSPGVFAASSSQEKYIVDIDLNTTAPDPPIENDSGLSSLQKEIDLNQIELQITTKLAMAENENNMNIEYSGPLTVEGLITEDSMMMRESDAIPESLLAGNGGSVEDLREGLTLDEECVKALRNELELKLPLAQVSSIEPEVDASWPGELPPPPELIVSYPGALSPIAEETRQQLTAYECDALYNPSIRTDSSESYPEPCNNSTDEVTELPTAAMPDRPDRSHTLQSSRHDNDTYTLCHDATSNEVTMSADSLNASPYRKPTEQVLSPIDDRTYNKNDDEKESNFERISQVSPFILSPTTDTSVPDSSDNFDNATGVSTLSKTTLPTDAKHSKPSETQCLSKATSIDSWCSNDTLYNVEENFDDLASDNDIPLDFPPLKEEDQSESDTLTHNEDDKDFSHCSTYIIHDSKSDPCETFSPDSIAANGNNTYTKIKETATTLTKSELNDSAKNTQTKDSKDLAYGTLMSGLPSYSNCTTEVISSMEDAWKLPQPEMVRRSPMEEDTPITPPKLIECDKTVENESPNISTEPSIKKMDSVEISCLQDNLLDSYDNSGIQDQPGLIKIHDSPDFHYRNMAHSVTSTPMINLAPDTEDIDAIPMKLPELNAHSPDLVPNFQAFFQSAEVRPQDISSNSTEDVNTNQDTEILLEGDSKTLSRISNMDANSLIAPERTPTYSDFENSAVAKPQDGNSKSSLSIENGMNSEEFRSFENSVRNRPQDISSVIDASSLLLKSERLSSELAMGSSTNIDFDQSSQSENRVNTNEQPQNIVISPPIVTNLKESHESSVSPSVSCYVNDFYAEEETEQPHSIIITEVSKDISKESSNQTYDSHPEMAKENFNNTYDSHENQKLNKARKNIIENGAQGEDIIKINVSHEHEDDSDIIEAKSPKIEVLKEIVEIQQPELIVNTVITAEKTLLNGSEANATNNIDTISANGDKKNEQFATVNFLHESFEELMESNVDDQEVKENIEAGQGDLRIIETPKDVDIESVKFENGIINDIENVEVTAKEDKEMTSVTENFLQMEKKFCQIDSYLPLLSDIRFTGPASEIMSTSFTQDSPTEPLSPECEQDKKRDSAADSIKEWDSDSDSHSTNSSSGEFIWKQRGSGDGEPSSSAAPGPESRSGDSGDSGPASGDSGSGSEGDEVEFVPSSWDCLSKPAKSSLRSLEHASLTPESKKRVVFKRQKYHCVYEYPREVEPESPATYLPDYSTFCEWDPSSAVEFELGYGQAYGDLFPLRAGFAFGADYDDDFFISSSARPFESLGVMSTSSQFFPGMHKLPPPAPLAPPPAPLAPPPAPPSPLPLAPPTLPVIPTAPLIPAIAKPSLSLDFTTPDSGVEDITPGSTTTEEDYKKKLETDLCWRPTDSGSSSEFVSPSSPGGEALGGLRHTRDKLKLDLPPSPSVASPRHARVFSFVLDKRRGHTPLVMTDDTPAADAPIPVLDDPPPPPEPTFSTFGKCSHKTETEQKAIVLDEVKEENEERKVEAVKGEGTVLDSGDEDSGIESSAKATLERNKPAPNVS